MTPPAAPIGLAIIDQEISDLKQAHADLKLRLAALEKKVHTEHGTAIEELDNRLDAHDVRLDHVNDALLTEASANRALLIELKRGNAEILALLRREARDDE